MAEAEEDHGAEFEALAALHGEESLERLVTGVLIEISETWETGKAYLSLN